MSGIGVGQDRVERADPVGRDDQQAIGARLVHVAHLPARVQDRVRAHASSTGSFSSRSKTPPRLARYGCTRNSASNSSSGQDAGVGDLLPHPLLELQPALPGVVGRSLDRFVRVVAGHPVIDERGQHLLAEEEAARRLQVREHPIGIDEESLHHPRHVAQHEVEQSGRVGQDHPFCGRVRDVALVPERHVLERHLRVPAHHAREPAHPLRDDGVPLVRHGAGALLPLGERLLHLPDLGSRQVPDLGRDPIQRGGGDGERRDELRVAIALDHLGARLFGAQAKPGADELLDARIDGRVRADDAADRADAHRLPGAPQTFAVAIQLERQDRELVPEAGRLRVDPVRPPDHDGVAMPQREAFHDAEQHLEPLEQQIGGRTQLQRQPGVQHIRRRHPEVDPAPLRPDRVGHHLDESGDVVARDRFDARAPVRR